MKSHLCSWLSDHLLSEEEEEEVEEKEEGFHTVLTQFVASSGGSGRGCNRRS